MANRELAGGGGADLIGGSKGNEVIFGRGGNDDLRGDEGQDVLVGEVGDDVLDGGGGNDGARFSGSALDYVISRGAGEVTVRDSRASRDGLDRLREVERLEFTDRRVFLDGTNNRPYARADAGLTTVDGSPLRIPFARLLANDREFDGDALSVSLPDSESMEPVGDVRIVGGTIVYTPPVGFQWALAAGNSYEDILFYTVSDGRGGSDTVSAKVTVTRPSNLLDNPKGAQTIRTEPGGPGSSGAPPYSLWDNSVVPTVVTDSDTRATVLGVKFQASTAGTINGIRFYKGPQNTGTHVGKLWSAPGTALATATFAGETASGWQQVTFATPVSVTAGTTYIASYSAPRGRYSETGNFFATSYTNGLLTAPSSVSAGGNGVYRYTTNLNLVPNQTIGANNYYVDVLFTPNNRAPVAVADSYTTVKDTPLTIAAPGVLGNDTDADFDPLTATVAVGPANGTLTLSTNGSFTYTPNPGYAGPDSFTYTARDSKGLASAAPAAVSLTVEGAANRPPVAVNDTASTNEDTAVTIAALANDSDPDLDPLTITSIGIPSHGTAVVQTGAIVYTPAANYSGPDSFTYTISDGRQGEATASIGLMVAPVNDPPVAVADSGFTTPADTARDFAAAELLANDSDPEADSLSISTVGGATNGTVELVAGGGVRFAPTAGYSGSAGFNYTVSDGQGGTASAAVSLTVQGTNRSPVAVGDTATTPEDLPVVVNVLGNDGDPDGNPLTVSAVDITGTQGLVTVNANNTVTYDPAGHFTALNAGQSAIDTFGYVVSDGQGGTATANVSVTITGKDNPPTNPIAIENQKPGSPQSEWGINGPDANLEGFATQMSVDQGQTVQFKIRTNATDYRIDIYRIGYYGGLGARKVATIDHSAGPPQSQPNPLVDTSTGLVDAGNWAVSASWSVPTDAVSGIYLAKLVREDGTFGENHIPFVVRDDDGHSDIVAQTADTTWQAYNLWGGVGNFYSGPFSSPIANRTYKVSYNRPFGDATNSVNRPLFDAEYPMIRWMEANGYDVSYISGVDTDARGPELLEHKAFVSMGHDEYWSGTQRANIENARANGTSLAFFSGNEVYWKTRWENSIDASGTPRRTLVTYKETWNSAKIDPNPAWTGTWRDPRFSPPADGGRPENGLTGTIFTVDSYRLDTIKVPAADGKMRFWRNTSVANLAPGAVATLNPNVLGYEWDEDLNNGVRPAGSIKLSSTTLNVPSYVRDYGNSVGPGTATHNLTLYRDQSSGALVFGAGTTRWSWGLDSNHINEASTPDPRMQQATVNLLADMGVQPKALQSGLVAAGPSTDATRPTSSITSPAGGSSTTVGSTVTITGTAADTGGRVGGVEVSVDGGATWQPATGRETWSYSWTPQIAGNAVIRSRALDDSLNMETPAGDVTVAVTQPPGPWSIWSATATPAVANVNDPNAVALGVKFRSDISGYVTGLRFYKSTQNTGTHTGKLWSATGTLLGQATFTNETASGWQQVALPTPVPIAANTAYVASYHAPSGHYAADNDYFATSGITSNHLRALSSPESGGNGVYMYGTATAFPSNSYRSTNYWVDVVFSDSLVA